MTNSQDKFEGQIDLRKTEVTRGFLRRGTWTFCPPITAADATIQPYSRGAPEPLPAPSADVFPKKVNLKAYIFTAEKKSLGTKIPFLDFAFWLTQNTPPYTGAGFLSGNWRWCQ